MTQKYDALKQKILKFRDERQWKQFHDPKNLAEGLCIEAAELLEHFLWKDTGQAANLNDDQREKAGRELADVFVFIIYLSHELGLDLFEEVEKKLKINEQKYPVHKARGNSKKYTEF